MVAIFGSKCDRCGAGKPAALPAASEPGSVLHPRASGYGNVAGRGAGSRTSPLRGPHLLRTIRASAVLAGRANGPGGERREGARREPEDACQLKERGDVPEQPWPGDREAGGGGGAFPRWRAASPRRAGAATRLRAVGRVVHLESAKLTAVAAAPRMQGSGRPAGAAAKPVGRFDELPPPPRGGAEATPRGSSSAWRPIGSPDARRGDPGGRGLSSQRTAPSAASGWVRKRRGCLRTRSSRLCSAACSRCRRARSRSP